MFDFFLLMFDVRQHLSFNIKSYEKADPTRRDMYALQLKALYEKHDSNPFKSLVFPLLQMPIFISFFFGLKQMGSYYPVRDTCVYISVK
jgi:membrane protein insertase Oxa1/YidC/SpoIIIJ